MRWMASAIPFLLACSDARPAVIGDPILDGGANVDGANTANVLWIGLSPLELVPAFSPSTFDYTVRCAAGDNPATLTVTDATGTTSTPVTLVENQLLSVRGYFIRCLPHDFPQITVGGNGTPTPGYFLVNGSTYAMVLDVHATPVWYARGSSVINVDSLLPNRVSFAPDATGTFGQNLTAAFVVHTLDDAGSHVVRAVGTPTDAHEFRRLPNGDHYLFTYFTTPHVDLTGLLTFGSDETMVDCAVQHVDAQGNLVWSWAASDHVDAVKESLAPSVTSTGAVDVFHCNSIDVDASGNLLVSMRQTSSLFYVDRATGRVVWKLGGSSYNKDGAALIQVASDPEGTFSTQHDARFVGTGHVTLYDDHGGASGGLARGVEYALDLPSKTATFAWQYVGTAQARYEGSFRRYADGESVIGWGFVPGDKRVLTEVDATGHDVFDVELGGEVSYRAVKVPLSQFDLPTLRATCAR